MTKTTSELPVENGDKTTWKDRFNNKVAVSKLEDGTFCKETRTDKHSDFEFLGDIYSYKQMDSSTTIKVYWDNYHSQRKLVKDKYGRLFHYRYDEEMDINGGDDRVDILWTLVTGENDSDDLSGKGGLSLLREPYIASAETNWVAAHECLKSDFTDKINHSQGISFKPAISFLKSFWLQNFHHKKSE